MKLANIPQINSLFVFVSQVHIVDLHVGLESEASVVGRESIIGIRV
jgi:hypothetical protein